MVTCFSYWETLFLKCFRWSQGGVWGLHEKRAGWYTWRYNENHWTGDAAVSIVCMIRPRLHQTPVWFYSMISYQRSIASRRGSARNDAPLRRTIVKHFHFHCYSSSEACTNRRFIYTPRLNIKPSDIIIISTVGIVYFTLLHYSIVLPTFRISPLGNLQWQ